MGYSYICVWYDAPVKKKLNTLYAFANDLWNIVDRYF